MRDTILDPLFEPLKMSNLTLKNRFYMAPMGTGFKSKKRIDYMTARARGGVALITTGECSVHPSGRAGIGEELRVETDDDIKPLSMLAKAVKEARAKIVLQLNHAGRYSPGQLLGTQSVAPSPIMSGYTGETPRELSTEETDDLVIAFAEAGLRARKAGFDGIEILASSGYLISQFLSPLTNKRQDKYGGDRIGRATFLFSILRETRKKVGDDFNICVKFDGDDGMQNGITLDDSLVIAPHLVQNGADRLHIWAGWHESPRPMLPMYVPRAAFTYLAHAIKKVVHVPVSTVGRINDPFIAADIISRNEADLIGLGRGLLADPDFVNKTEKGRVSEIRSCTACCFCFDQILSSTRQGKEAEIKCAINPELGREGENVISAAKNEKNIVIVGAGPAGMEAARIASLRGHKVTLFEKDTNLGGMINLAYLPPHKEELKNLIEYYTSQMKLLNINLNLGKTFTPDDINRIKPDAIILASGAISKVPNIQGMNDFEVITALEVLKGRVPEWENIAVIGGGMIGLETAEFLADKGKRVTVFEMYKLAADVGSTSRWGLISRLRRKLKLMSSTKVIKITKKGIIVIGRDGEKKEIETDAVVIAAGLESLTDLEHAIKKTEIEYYLAGSCKEPGQIAQAIEDGFEIGCAI